MRSLIPLAVITLLLCGTASPLTAQERQASFDTKGKILEIKSGSPYAVLWKAEAGDFEHLVAFEADSIVVLEIYRTIDGTSVRTRKSIDRLVFIAKQQQVDSLSAVVLQRGGDLTPEDIEDLRTTFTYDQTEYSALHGITASIVFESSAAFWIVSGGSYFVISAISDNLAVTRANVEAAKYGHMTGLWQGYLLGATLFSGRNNFEDTQTAAKGTLALTSLGGIAHAVVSYKAISAPDVNPTVQYLRMTAERHSMIWGLGAMLLVLGKDVEMAPLSGGALTLSLSSNFWSASLFGLNNRHMSWADALLADEFMTPWYLSLLALGSSLEVNKSSEVGLLMAGGGVAGYLLGVNVNDGRMQSLATVKRTRLLMYGGALLGLGIVIGAEPEGKAALWIVSGTTWLGYVIGARFGAGEHSSAWDLRVMPENILLGELQRPTARRPFVQPVPVAVLSFTL